MSEWKLVPVEPTAQMLTDGWNKSAKELSGPNASGACYRAMLAAAPSPEWVKVSERLPTREDADESDRVWVFNAMGVLLLHWSRVVQFPDRYEVFTSHWMPKPRQQPPAPPEDK